MYYSQISHRYYILSVGRNAMLSSARLVYIFPNIVKYFRRMTNSAQGESIVYNWARSKRQDGVLKGLQNFLLTYDLPFLLKPSKMFALFLNFFGISFGKGLEKKDHMGRIFDNN